MKKIVVVFAALLTLQSFGQKVGLKAGLALSRYSVVSNRPANPLAPRTDVTSAFKPGLVLGGVVDFNLDKNLFLRSGLEMVVKGGVETGTYTDFYGSFSGPYKEKRNFAAFDFPLLLLYKLRTNEQQRLLLGGGFVPGILIEGMLDKIDLGAAVLLGYEFARRINVSMTYNHGLKNAVSYPFDYSSLKNRSLAISFGYAFRQKTAVEKERFQVAKAEPVAVEQPVKAFYAEIGSPGGFLSFNYDWRFAKSHKGLGMRAGIGALLDLSDIGFTIPIALNYLQGDKAHFFEAGAGATYFQIEQSGSDSWFQFGKEKFLAPFISAGYRYQPLYKRFMFRAAITQFFGIRTYGIFRLPGLSFGYRF
jgi:hypothetical protein